MPACPCACPCAVQGDPPAVPHHGSCVILTVLLGHGTHGTGSFHGDVMEERGPERTRALCPCAAGVRVPRQPPTRLPNRRLVPTSISGYTGAPSTNTSSTDHCQPGSASSGDPAMPGQLGGPGPGA